TLSDHEALLAAEVARLSAVLKGQDASARNRLARLLPHAPAGLVAHTVISGLEQALWDVAGQEAGHPIHAMLGGALRENVPLYANINRGASPRTHAGFADAARRAVAAGFRAVKLAPFEPMVWEDAAEPSQRVAYAEGLARIAAVRDAVSSAIDIMVDAHWRFSPGGAAALIRDVADTRPAILQAQQNKTPLGLGRDIHPQKIKRSNAHQPRAFLSSIASGGSSVAKASMPRSSAFSISAR
ncbi:MAG: enolase C-terminal domain-like protein, partial [Alphaproteobacteria bacterium]